MADKIAKGRTTRGWRNESHKLAPDDADHIRDLRQAGAVTAMELAESYGITRQRVGQICREVVA
jgi:adenosylmethionine-8-amino-7-oxononanoate aminotransferase